MKPSTSSLWSFTLFILMSIAFPFYSIGQALKEINGNVSDAATHSSVAGVSIIVKGSNIGTMTDRNGEYHIQARKGDILIFSSVNYEKQEISVTNQTVINVLLEGTASKLNDVVVVGYGTQKRSDITGSVTTVSKQRLSELPVTNVMNALEGSTAGLNIAQSASAPGNSPKVLIRGANSINASTSPLIVVDGVPFSNLGGSINDINPNDIESIEVLKDASAVAIYGTRGSSGVILITTKRGKAGKPTIRYSVYSGPEFQKHALNPMGGAQYSQTYLDYTKQMRIVPNTVPVPNQSEFENYKAGHETDWIKEISQQGIIQDHNLSISGGTENVKYFLSGEYQKEKGVLKGFQYNRASIRSNLDANLTDWLSVGTSLFFTSNNSDGGRVNYYLATVMSPYGIEYTGTGDYNKYPMYPEVNFASPFMDLKVKAINRTKNLNGTFYAEVKPSFIKGLKYKINGNYSYLPGRYDSYTGRDDSYNGSIAAKSTGGYATVNNYEMSSWLLENILSYDKSWNKHHVDFTALYSAQQKNIFNSGIIASMFINDELLFNNISAAGLQTASSYSARDALLSQMARINYSYASKYLLTATARRDGYSAFGSATNKYATFPSIALGWNISKENFMKNILFVNTLKLRASYGITGNQAIGIGQTLSTQAISNYIYNSSTTIGIVSSSITSSNGQGTFSESQLGNSALNWESTTGTNLGIDFSVLKNRINGTVEVYKTTTNDLLLNRQLPTITGYTSIIDNLGSVSNKGVELTLNTRNIEVKNFSWTTDLNFASNRNKILSLYGDNKDDVGNKWFIGKSLGAVYEYRMIGVWQVGEDPSQSDPTAKPGDLKYEDVDHDGRITSLDKVYQGNTFPEWTGGITNTFNYKNLHLNIFIHTFQGALKNSQFGATGSAGRVNIPKELGDYWTEENKSNTRASLSTTKGSNYPVEQSFTRLKDITLSYTLSSRLCDRLKIGSLTAYLSGRNIYTFTNWIGEDPELELKFNQAGTSLPGPADFPYPLVSSYVFGINLSLR
jgi:TonB-linked SusC/RagA family outer membrane protein